MADNDTIYSLAQLNGASSQQFAQMLDGIYEHSPWVAQAAAAARPLQSLTQLKFVMAQAVREADPADQLALIRAHPELAGKAMVSNKLTAESTDEQAAAGLTHCTKQEFESLQRLNAAYKERFGFPFILAVRGPRGLGLRRSEIIDTFARRLQNHPDFERAEALRNIHRIAEIRLNERFKHEPVLGNQVWDWAQALAAYSDPEYVQRDELTVTYLTEAHQACARQLCAWMTQAGFDEVRIDAVGNVVGIYRGSDQSASCLLTGSHFDTVRNAGKYDGRLGILVPIVAVARLSQQNRRLPVGIEVVGFAEEEGQRYKTSFLSAAALAGQFDSTWLDQADADGITMREAMIGAGLSPNDIPGIARNPGSYEAFVEIHIEQGPVLSNVDQPLAVVTSINGASRFLCEITGLASHAGTTPMGARHDAALAGAELMLYAEQRACAAPDVVATVGMLDVPGGSINVVPGKCCFSLDVRAPSDALRESCEQDILRQLDKICERRGVTVKTEQIMRAAAAPCAPAWQDRWADAVQAQGIPAFRMPSGAGHDAMKMHDVMPQAMLFVRGLNAGISHNPLESITNDDAELAVQAFIHLTEHLTGQSQ